jgi:NADH:ubiquinone oxidoreductase subunit 3 (subunit A)
VPSRTLPVLVFIAVMAAFCVLAALLDRLIPPRQPRPAQTEVEALEPVEVKKIA